MGPDLARSLIDLALIDEYRLYLCPVVAGRGKLFFGGPRPLLRLVANDLVGEGTIRLTYVPAQSRNWLDRRHSAEAMANSKVPRATLHIRSYSDMLKKNESVQNPRKGRARKRIAGRTGGFSPPSMISSPELLIGGSDDEFRQVVYLFVKVLGRLMSCREAFGEAISLTGSQFAVLVGVAYRQGESGVTVKELSRYVHLAPTHVTTEVGRLHRRGLLVKKAGTEDRRSVLVSLTPQGEATVASVAPFVRRINDILFGGVTATQFAAAHATFAKLARNSEYVLAELKQRH